MGGDAENYNTIKKSMGTVTDNTDIPMSDDPEENLRLENELLRMRLKAELDREPPKTDDMPPAMANSFLKTALALEHALINQKRDTIFNILGKPSFTPAQELADGEITPALQHLVDLLKQKHIRVVFTSRQDNRTRYAFITEELFLKETDYVDYGGMESVYHYEIFHPNPKDDLETSTLMFIASFEGNLFRDEDEESLFAEIVWTPKGNLTRKEVTQKLRNVLDCYTSIQTEAIKITDIRVVEDKKSSGGMVEGYIKYNATLESHEVVPIIGPFSIFHMKEGNEWLIKMFDMPGFEF
jgi:hypothetical protein